MIDEKYRNNVVLVLVAIVNSLQLFLDLRFTLSLCLFFSLLCAGGGGARRGAASTSSGPVGG